MTPAPPPTPPLSSRAADEMSHLISEADPEDYSDDGELSVLASPAAPQPATALPGESAEDEDEEDEEEYDEDYDEDEEEEDDDDSADVSSVPKIDESADQSRDMGSDPPSSLPISPGVRRPSAEDLPEVRSPSAEEAMRAPPLHAAEADAQARPPPTPEDLQHTGPYEAPEAPEADETSIPEAPPTPLSEKEFWGCESCGFQRNPMVSSHCTSCGKEMGASPPPPEVPASPAGEASEAAAGPPGTAPPAEPGVSPSAGGHKTVAPAGWEQKPIQRQPTSPASKGSFTAGTPRPTSEAQAESPLSSQKLPPVPGATPFEETIWPSKPQTPPAAEGGAAGETGTSFHRGGYEDQDDVVAQDYDEPLGSASELRPPPPPGQAAPPPTPFHGDPVSGYDMGGQAGAHGAPFTRGAKEAYLVQKRRALTKFQREALDHLRAWDSTGEARFTAAQALRLVRTLQESYAPLPKVKPAWTRRDFFSCGCVIWLGVLVAFVWAPLLISASLSRELRAQDSGVLLAAVSGEPAATAELVSREGFGQLQALPEAKLRRIRDCTFVHRGARHSLRVASLVRATTGTVRIASADGSSLALDANSTSIAFSRPFQGVELVSLTAEEGDAVCSFGTVAEAPRARLP